MSNPKESLYDKIARSTLNMFEDELQEKGTIPTYYPDMLRAVLDVNRNARKISEIDWRKELAHMHYFWQCIPEKVPMILWLWGLLGQIEDPEKRLKVLKELKDARLSYPGSSNDKTELFVSIEALMALNKKIQNYENEHLLKPKEKWPKGQMHFNELAYILTDEVLTGEDLMGISISMACSSDKTKNAILIHILKGYFYRSMSIHCNVIDAISRMFKADAYRLAFLDGKLEIDSLPESEPIPRKIRNQYFDIFIAERLRDVKDSLDNDTSLVVDPTEIECYEELLRRESDRVTLFKKFNDEIYPSREEVLEVADIFIQYLKIKIDKLKQADAKIAKQGNAPIYAEQVTIKENHGSITNIEK